MAAVSDADRCGLVKRIVWMSFARRTADGTGEPEAVPE